MRKNRVTIKADDVASFVVTGFYAYSNRRFKTIHTTDYRYYRGINLWKGRKYVVLKNGKRVLMETVNC